MSLANIVKNPLTARPMERCLYYHWKWWKNFIPSLSALATKKSHSTYLDSVYGEFRKEGIADLAGMLSPDWTGALQSEACKQIQNAPPFVPGTKDVRALKFGYEESKGFLQSLLPETLSYDSVFVRYAIRPEFLDVINRYMGMKTRLRMINLWLNHPTEGAPASTQLWHKDSDDFKNAKIFTYLSDVDMESGPFTYLPGSQRFGHRLIHPPASSYGRVTDEQMLALVPRKEWSVCTGAAGTAVVADTCGFHKGEKPRTKTRLMLLCHYVSSAAISKRELFLEGLPPVDLSEAQRFALYLEGT